MGTQTVSTPAEPAEPPADVLADELRASMRGQVIDRGHPSYDRARRVWNGLIDRRPAVIARCEGVADVVEAVRVTRTRRPTVSIRGGGHQVAGSAVCDDGLVIDLSAMRGVHVDATAGTVRVQAGATWAEVDRETQLFGLITPGGEISTTGVAGLTLGGGMGAVMRRHGLSCDNVRSVQVVTADGVVRTASRAEHPELWWAARGGGRGLGVVTSFELELHPVGPQVATALAVYPYADAASVLRRFCDLAPQLPDELTPELMLGPLPASPDVPEELHGVRVVLVASVYAGPVEDGEAALAPLRELGGPIADLSGPAPYVDLQQAFDDVFPAGGRYYMKSHFLDEIGDDAVRCLLEHDVPPDGVTGFVGVRTLGGAVARADADASAYAHRAATFNVSIDPGWTDPALDDDAIGWARSMWDALRPFGTGGVYVNFSGLDGEAAPTPVFGAAADRLEEVRRGYDPDGVFAAAARRP